VQSIDAAIEAAADAAEIMIIGGGEIYGQFLDRATRVYLTRVDVHVDGDTHLPPLGDAQWRVMNSEDHLADESNEYDYTFSVLERIAL